MYASLGMHAQSIALRKRHSHSYMCAVLDSTIHTDSVFIDYYNSDTHNTRRTVVYPNSMEFTMQWVSAWCTLFSFIILLLGDMYIHARSNKLYTQ